jgi:hypothetical protein
MRIHCAKCDGIHNSTVKPFKYDLVPYTESSIAEGGVVEKEIITDFVCTHCGATNTIVLSWYAEV